MPFENSLAPAFVRIFYHSAFAPHVMTRPTNAWSPPSGGFTNGSVLDWTGAARDIDDMVKDFVNAIKPGFSADVTFDNYIVYTQADEDAEPLIAALGDLSIDGTFVGSAQEKAAQCTYSLLDSEGAKAKIVLLDSALLTDFEPIGAVGDLTAAEQAMIAEFISTANGWASRNGARPTIFRKATYKLNDALRRSYRMD